MRPLLEQVKQNYGNPIAIVSDMGKAVQLVAEDVFPDSKKLICHFHFLRDIGKDLLETPYSAIRNGLKKHGVSKVLRYRLRELKKGQFNEYESIIHQLSLSPGPPEKIDCLTANAICYALVIWMLDGKRQGNGYGFPFDRVHLDFYTRITLCYRQLNSYMDNQSIVKENKAARSILRLIRDLEPIATDAQVALQVRAMQEYQKVFDALRDAMKMALPGQNKGLNDDGMDADIKTIKEKVIRFTKDTMRCENYKTDRKLQKMITQISIYEQKLFADPVRVKNDMGEFIIQPQRTNNMMEQFFRSFRRGHRRTSGNDAINKKLQAMLADTMLIKNLDNQKYMEMLLGNNKSIKQVFADIDTSKIIAEMRLANKQRDKIPPKINAVIKKSNIFELLHLPQSSGPMANATAM